MSSNESVAEGLTTHDEFPPSDAGQTGDPAVSARAESDSQGAAAPQSTESVTSEATATGSATIPEASSHEFNDQPQPVVASAAAEARAAAETSAAEPAGNSTTGTAGEQAPAAAEGEQPKRRVRLAPTFHPQQARPIPTIPAPSAPAEPTATRQPAAAPPSPPPDVAESPAAETQSPMVADTAAAVAAPAEAPQTPPAPPAPRHRPQPVELPPADLPLDAELEAEIEAALSSGELDLLDRTPSVVEPSEDETVEASEEGGLAKGARLTGKIQSLHGDDVFLDIGHRCPAVVSRRQFVSGKKPEVGQLIEVFVDRVDEDEGLIHVNLPKGLRKIAGNWESLAVGQIVDCIVTGVNKGGLEVTVSNLRGFLPASQVELGFVSDLQPYLGQKLRVQVMEVQPRKRNLIVSRRAYLAIERKEAEENLWKSLEVGQVFSGKVKTIKDYGAFIDLGGVDGFLHVGEISWMHIKHPKDILSEGQQVDVKIIGLDPEKKKISLGMRQLTQNPWSAAAEKYAVGSRVQGTVTRTAAFGAFVELEPGVEGLIHISELDHQRVRRVTDVLKVGQTVDAQVLEVDPERKRIALSLKALIAKPEPKADEDLAPSAGAPPIERKRKGPLKGGTSSIGGPTGGKLFGNPEDWN